MPTKHLPKITDRIFDMMHEVALSDVESVALSQRGRRLNANQLDLVSEGITAAVCLVQFLQKHARRNGRKDTVAFLECIADPEPQLLCPSCSAKAG